LFLLVFFIINLYYIFFLLIFVLQFNYKKISQFKRNFQEKKKNIITQYFFFMLLFVIVFLLFVGENTFKKLYFKMEHISQNISTMGGMMMGEKGGRLVVVVFWKFSVKIFWRWNNLLRKNGEKDEAFFCIKYNYESVFEEVYMRGVIIYKNCFSV